MSNPVTLIHRLVLLAIVLSLLAVPGLAAKNLVDNSPFIPEGWRPPEPRPVRPVPPPRPERPPGPQPLDQIEFRGMAKLGGNLEFSLFDPTEKRSFWIGVGKSEGGFSVVEFNEAEGAVVVRHDGRTRTITLRESKVQAMEETPPPRTRAEILAERRADQPVDREERMRELAEQIRNRRVARRAILGDGEDEEGAVQQHQEMPELPPMPE